MLFKLLFPSLSTLECRVFSRSDGLCLPMLAGLGAAAAIFLGGGSAVFFGCAGFCLAALLLTDTCKPGLGDRVFPFFGRSLNRESFLL
jgi:hypothetical protein